MQKVSKAYKESMKSSLRERAYIMISFGLVNQEAQAKATVDNGSYAYYSNKDNIFGEHIDDTVYATLEEEFTKVDGSMFFLPRATEGGRYYDTGIVSDKLISEARCEVIISLNTIATDFKGLTINFGENYPVDFDIVGSTGQTIEFRGNTKSKWSTEEVLENTTYIKLVFYKMKNPQSRLRIHHVVIVPDTCLYNAQMHNTSSGGWESGAANTTAGGYVGSDMYKSNLEQAKTTIKSAFSGHVLKHRIYLTNAVANGRASGGAWCDSEVDLMCEQMVYGSGIFSPVSDGSNVPANYRVEKSQLPLFQHEPSRICNRATWWLRDVITASDFAYVNDNGSAGYSDASNSLGVRPAFCIS